MVSVEMTQTIANDVRKEILPEVQSINLDNDDVGKIEERKNLKLREHMRGSSANSVTDRDEEKK